MKDLIERLEAAEGGSRELDLSIAEWLYANPTICGALVNYDPALWLERHGGWTESLDAALALAERVLPGCSWQVQKDMSGFIVALRNGVHEVETEAETPALALCSAILRARLDEEGKGGEA